MFISYDELELFEFFESEPGIIGECEAGECIYSYQQDGFKIILLISTYEMYIEISVTYNDNIVYSQRHNNVQEIKKTDIDDLKVTIDKDNVIVIKKQPQIGVIVE